MPVGNALYLGYGPITYKNGPKHYITPGSKARMTIVYPRIHEKTINTVLQYIHSFGTIGSRSRNGWGSVALSGEGFRPGTAGSFSDQTAPRAAERQCVPLFSGPGKRPSLLADK